MNILVEIIRRTLEIKPYCTLNELASVSGKKKLEVLREITDNKKLLKFDKRGNICGFVKVRLIQLAKMLQDGRCYKLASINYGCQSIIEWNDPRAEQLKQSYYCGGFGDSWAVKEILDTPENRQKIEQMGAVLVDNVGKNATKNIDHFWNKPALVINILGLMKNE